MKIIALIISTLGLAVSINTVSAADVAKGESTLKQHNCAACHGADFAKSIDDTIPSLAGQHADYLVQALRQYRAGDNTHAALSRNNGVMTNNAKKLSDEEINNMAAYLAHLKGGLSVEVNKTMPININLNKQNK
jgi:cytochrome c553